tara:strand:+ start:1141 stop:1473 length:333 start_codon:yes stop_codon:yes gene_type:complete
MGQSENIKMDILIQSRDYFIKMNLLEQKTILKLIGLKKIDIEKIKGTEDKSIENKMIETFTIEYQKILDKIINKDSDIDKTIDGFDEFYDCNMYLCNQNKSDFINLKNNY